MNEEKSCDTCKFMDVDSGFEPCKGCKCNLPATHPKYDSTENKWESWEDKEDVVNKPKHYIDGRKFEPIEVINDWKLGFCLGNALKYIARAGRKYKNKEIEDLQKAIWYINKRIEFLKREENI